MALKDLLKLFKSDNGYDVVVGKKEIDENFEVIADKVDENITAISKNTSITTADGFKTSFAESFKTVDAKHYLSNELILNNMTLVAIRIECVATDDSVDNTLMQDRFFTVSVSDTGVCILQNSNYNEIDYSGNGDDYEIQIETIDKSDTEPTAKCIFYVEEESNQTVGINWTVALSSLEVNL